LDYLTIGHSPIPRIFDIYMSKGYFIIVWPCAPSCKIVTSELIPLFFSQRWPWNTLRNRVCGVACCRKEWGEAFSSIFTTDTKSWSIPDWGVIL
jgi:hypothetical protein